jgi:hypothetical protein
MKTRLIALLVVLPLALAACGGGRGQPTSSSTRTGTPAAAKTLAPHSLLGRAAVKTERAKGMRVAVSGTIDTPNASIKSSGAGEFALGRAQGTFQATLSNPADGANVSVGEIFDGSVLYLNSSVLYTDLPASTKWMSIDLPRASFHSFVDPVLLTVPLTSSDARMALDTLRATRRAKALGKERIGGIPTTHYRATVDPGLAKRLDAGRPDAEGRPRYGRVDVWVDANGIVRRLSESYSYIPNQIGVRMTMTFDPLSRAAHVQLPQGAADRTSKAEREFADIQQAATLPG